jgi:DNA polymerase III delta prime subunit
MAPKTWIEKYRPKSLDEVAMDALVRRQINSFELTTLPNLILSGAPGTGKTSTAILIARKLLSNSDAYMELNASDNRGISMIASLTTNFIRKQFEDSRKIIILDEADNITKKAQEQLISVMECYPNVCFVLTCNDMGNIIEAVQSRCMLFAFKRLPTDELCQKLRVILSAEKATIESDEVLRSIIRLSDNDIRCCLNYLQSLVEVNERRHVSVADVSATLRLPSLQSIHCWMSLAATVSFDTFVATYFDLMQSGFGNSDVLNMIVCYYENLIGASAVCYDTVARREIERETEQKREIAFGVLRIVHDAHFRMIQTTDGDELLMIRCVADIHALLCRLSRDSRESGVSGERRSELDR